MFVQIPQHTVIHLTCNRSKPHSSKFFTLVGSWFVCHDGNVGL